MFWKLEDVDNYKEGLSSEEKEAWVKIVNSAAKAFKANGINNYDDKAIAAANAKATESKSDIDAYIDSISTVNFSNSISTTEFKKIKTETTEEGLLLHDLPVFKSGVYRDTEYSDDYIDRNLIGQFDVDEDVPVQADHSPSTNDTLGWVKGLRRKGKMMYSDFLLVDPKAIERWKQGLSKKFSVSISLVNDKLREISIVAFPYVTSARVHSFDQNNETGEYTITIDDAEFEIKKDSADHWFLSPWSRRDKNGELIQEESLNITDEAIDNIDADEDIAQEDDSDYSYGDNLTKQDFSKLTKKYIDSLPDSSFMLIRRPVKDKSRDRALPIKDASGKFSRSHVRTALVKASRVKEFSNENIVLSISRLNRISKKLGVDLEQKKSGKHHMKKNKLDLRELDLSAYEGEAAEILKTALSEIGSLEKERDEYRTNLANAEQKLASQEDVIKLAKVESHISQLKADGKLTPAQEETTKAFMLTLSTEKIEDFVGVLSQSVKQVPIGEETGSEESRKTESKDVIDTDALEAPELNAIAEKLAADQGMDFHDALDLIYDGKVSKNGNRIE